MNIFVDVGAGRGEIFTLDHDDVLLPELRRQTSLFCIEPSARNFVHLALASREHAGEWRAVHLLNAALSDRFGWLPFFEKTDHSGDSLHRDWVTNEGRPHVHGVGVLDVVAVLDQITDHFAEHHMVTLKLDCEGEESRILQRLLHISGEPFFRKGNRILVEWHNADPMLRQMLEHRYRQRGIELELWNH